MTENISAVCHACGRSTLQRLNLRPGPDQAYRHDLERSRQRAADLEPIIADLREGGARSLRKLAAALNERGVPAPRGGLWKATQVRRIVDQYAR